MPYNLDQTKSMIGTSRRNLAILAPIMIILSLSSFSYDAKAANWYVRPNGTTYGSSNGTNWSNAIAGLSGIVWSSVSCGDTIWVAGGTYTQNLLPAKKCTSASRLAIRRARSDAPEATSSAGWSASFHSSVHQTNGAGIIFNGDTDYITISGRTTSAGGTHGWWIDLRGRTSGSGIEFVNGASADFNTMEYMDLHGPGFVTYTGDGRGIDATPFSSATGNTISHMKIHDWESTIYNAGINNTTYEWVEVYGVRAVNASQFHPNALYNANANGLTVRYSVFHDDVGEGIFVEQSGGVSNLFIYGNTFYNIGTKTIQITGSTTNTKILNNTFDNTSASVQVRTDQGGSCGGSSETRNNYFYSNSSLNTCGTMSNNLIISSSPNPFVNRPSHDYHIAATVGTNYPRNAGTNLATYFQNDVDSVKFGADGSWDIGAYEFNSNGVASLEAPTALRVLP